MERAIEFATTRDGVRIGYWQAGHGTPLVALDVPCLSHAHEELTIAQFARWHSQLALSNRLVRMDFRGTGASQRDGVRISLRGLRSDLLAVAQKLRLGRFVLFARDGSVPIAIDFAASMPDLLDGLVLYNGWFDGPNHLAHKRLEAMRSLPAVDWEFFTSTLAKSFVGVGGSEAEEVANYYRKCVEPEMWGQYLDFFSGLDVTRSLSAVTCPTLVLHPGRNQLATREASMNLTVNIRNARLITFRGPVLPLGDTSLAATAIQEFIASIHAGKASGLGLTSREEEVVRLLEVGKSNQEIASDLVISPFTVAHHVSNILAKTGAANRTEAAYLASQLKR